MMKKSFLAKIVSQKKIYYIIFLKILYDLMFVRLGCNFAVFKKEKKEKYNIRALMKIELNEFVCWCFCRLDDVENRWLQIVLVMQICGQ